ncbi:hypothetical protein ACWIUD_00265 [Helicobacter sp. 23-1044]
MRFCDSQNLKAICHNKILRFAPNSQNLQRKINRFCVFRVHSQNFAESKISQNLQISQNLRADSAFKFHKFT